MISQTRDICVRKPSDWAAFINWIPDTNHRLSCAQLGAIALSCVSIDIFFRGFTLLVGLATAACIGLAWNQHCIRLQVTSRRMSWRYRFSRNARLAMGLGVLLVVTLLADPVQAQFFGDAESWMASNFGTDTGDAIPLVFNVLRGLFLLYVGISLVRVINAARQDEDWQTIARTPLIIIIAVTAGDILTTLITG